MKEFTITNEELANIQEFTLRAKELKVYDEMFNDMDMSRPDIFKLLAGWAHEFTEKYKDKDWVTAFYYDEVDDFLRNKFSLLKNPYIDRDGFPYDSEGEHCWPAGGGLHKDCEFNADALYAFYTAKSRDKIFAYLTKKGFLLTTYCDDGEIWVKGNTEITFECYDKGADLWAYVHTELLDEK